MQIVMDDLQDMLAVYSKHGFRLPHNLMALNVAFIERERVEGEGKSASCVFLAQHAVCPNMLALQKRTGNGRSKTKSS